MPQKGATLSIVCDACGFLFSERHPETGPNGNGPINYVRDAFGQVRRQTYASRDLSYLYDGGGRLTKIKNTGLDGHVLVQRK